MIHQFRDKKEIARKKKITRNAIGFGIFIILVILGIFQLSGKFFNFAGRPVWKVEEFFSNSVYEFSYLIRTKASISKENHDLIDEISNIRLRMTDYDILKKENDELKEILGRIGTKNNFILANILTKPNHSPYDTIIIDIGGNLKIKEGDLIYANGILPIGIVSKVYDNTSLITLYSSPGQKTEGFLDSTNASVILNGRGGGNFEMIIPFELSVEKGAIVYLPGNSSLPIALVDEIISGPTDPFKKVILSSPVNIQNLKWVEIKK